MRLARFCQLVPFVFFVDFAVEDAARGQSCQPPNPCGQLQVTAGIQFKVSSSSAVGTPASFTTVNDTDETPFNEEHGIFVAENQGGLVSNTGRANAVALGGATARVGDLALDGKATVTTADVFREHGATVNGRRSMGIRGGSGSAETFVSANVSDFVSFNTTSFPLGKRLLVSARLTVSGGFTGNTSYHAFDPIFLLPVDGGPLVTPPDAGASVDGSAVMTASKGALLVAPNSVPSPLVEVASFRREYGINSHGTVTETSSPPPSEIIWTFSAPNRQADPMGYGFSLTMRAHADAPTTAAIAGDFHGSVHWGGITSVADADTGALIADWTVTSESGFDYSKSLEEQVPEPATLWLLAVSSATLLATRRHHPRPR